MAFVSKDEYKEFLNFKAASSNVAALELQSGKSSVCFSQSLSSSSWILDSGASDHIAGNPSLFSNLSSTKNTHFITLADGSKVQATGVGKISPLPSLDLDSVLLVPGTPFNLLSISKLTRSLNCSVTFSSDSFHIQDRTTGQMIGAGSESHGLYFLQSPSSTVCAAAVSPEILHNRLGHPNLNKLKIMIPRFSHLHSLQCEPCQLGKHVRSSFKNKKVSRSKFPFELVHSDVWGPCRTTSVLGFRYFVTFIDDYSRCTWIYLMKERSELLDNFKKFCSEVSTQFGRTIYVFRSDNAKEYFSSSFNSFMITKGMIHQSSCSHTSQQNGVAERKHRHLLDTARTLLLQANVPLRFWADAILTAGYLINRMPSSVLGNQVPHSLLFPNEPTYKMPLRIFGCTCFVHDLSPGKDKLAAKAIKCIFLGYSRVQKGYKCYSPSLHRFFISADVTFFENTPFFTSKEETVIPSPVLPIPFLDTTTSKEETVIPSPVLPIPLVDTTNPRSLESSANQEERSTPLITYQRRSRNAPAPQPVPVHEPSASVPDQSSQPTSDPPDPPITIRKGNRITRNPHPIYNFVSYHRLSPVQCAFTSSLSSISIPKNVQEALSHPGWRQAMIEEMQALEFNQTWSLVPLPTGKNPVGCRCIFTVKVGPNGTVDRLKARLVAK